MMQRKRKEIKDACQVWENVVYKNDMLPNLPKRAKDLLIASTPSAGKIVLNFYCSLYYELIIFKKFWYGIIRLECLFELYMFSKALGYFPSLVKSL